MSTVRRSMLFSLLDSYLSIALNLAAYMVLARLLKPAEVGLFAVTQAMLSVMQVLRDFGLVSYLIQKTDLDDSHVATGWGVALTLGGSLFVLVQLAAGALGQFYGDPQLSTAARLLACNLLILPFNSVCLALLRRDLQFQTLMRYNLLASVLSTVSTVLLAWGGAGVLALVAGALGTNVLLALQLARHPVARRLRRPSLQHWRELLRFGGPVTAANVVTSVAMDINDMAAGKLLGFAAVGQLSRAQGVMSLFNRDFMNAIRNVAFPAFAKAHREDGSAEPRFTAFVGNVTAMAWTYYGFAALFPLELLRLMFGPQWDSAAPLVPWLCLAGALNATSNLLPAVMMASGHARLVARADLCLQPVRMAFMVLVCYFLRSLEALAIASMVMALVAVPYFYAFKQRCMPTAFLTLGRQMARNLLLTAIGLAGAAMLAWQRPPHGALGLPLFLLAAAVTALSWLAGLWLLRHPLWQELSAFLRARRPR